MYDIRQFRPALYLLLALGLSGFALSAEEPGLWALAMFGLLLNVWLLMTGRFVPLPRLVAAGATILALLYIAVEIRTDVLQTGTAPILIVGEFLVLLHLVKLYEQRANRDYAQLIVLSLLLMAASSISTASLWFGILLMIYLFVALYCCLLFHLKVEADAAKALLGSRQENINPAVLRQDQRRLSASMRRLTGLVSFVSLTMAVVVFVFFPRTGTEGLFGHHFMPATQVLTGFNDRVSLEHVARIDQSEEVVAQVKVALDGKPWGGTQPLLLRGTTLDQYVGDNGVSSPWQWKRSGLGQDDESSKWIRTPGVRVNWSDSLTPPPADYMQEVTIQPSDTSVVFAMAGAYALEFSDQFVGHFWLRDGALTSNQMLADSGAVRYTIWSSGDLPPPSYPLRASQSWIDPQLAVFAKRPEVSGTDGAGRSLAALRGTPDAPADVDARIANSIEAFLRANYQYTLDLTRDRDAFAGKDPMVVFLLTVKHGHCEYFAGAMTLMCQSLGIPARMVVGYRCDDYNDIGQYYTVRRSHAHAWVEVLTDGVWRTYDPTSSNELITAEAGGWMGKLKNLFDYLDYRWGTTVVAYGQENRRNVMDAMNLAMSKTAVNSTQSLGNIPARLRRLPNLADWLAEKIAGPMLNYPWLVGDMMLLLITCVIVLVTYYFYSQYQLRRRAWRIGLGSLPSPQRRRLARELGFYDDLLRLLERRGITRTPQLTPMEFSRQLEFLPHQTYHDILRLTRLFYRIRYGGAVLNPHRRRRMGDAILRVAEKV